jgi:hypothetical protein
MCNVLESEPVTVTGGVEPERAIDVLNPIMNGCRVERKTAATSDF